jgi:hypothetical protein
MTMPRGLSVVRGLSARLMFLQALVFAALALKPVLLSPPAASLAAQAPGQGSALPPAPDAFLDPTAGELWRAARANWQSIDSSVVRYTAVIKQRVAAGLRTPLKDRTLYRNESAVRAFWDRDHDALLQVLGTRAQHPGRENREMGGALDWMEDLTIDRPFEPGGDRLLFALGGDRSEGATEPDTTDFWFAHPLGAGADTLYRYRSGDTLTLSLPDGRRLRTVQLDVLPRIADPRRITGTLWLEPETGALVRAVYRLSRELDVMRDIPEVRAENEAGEFRMVPGILKPWTFAMTLVAIDYSLWEFRVWLPRSMRVEGEVAIGIMKMPITFDVAYGIESVTTVDDVAQGPDPGLQERRFGSRAEAMEFLARVMSDPGGVTYAPATSVARSRGLTDPDSATGEPGETLARTSGTRTSRYLIPEDPSVLETSPHLPPPVWESAPGFASEDELSDMVRTMANLPPVPVRGIPWDLNWGWARHDLLRYNRVEGPAIGGRFEAQVGTFMGPLDVQASGFFGLADLEPKGRLSLERGTVLRRVALGGYRELRPTDPQGRYLGLGSSLNAFLFGRDDGEYYMATGADLLWRPPAASRASYSVRLYGERQDAVSNKTDFALFRAFDGGGTFRPNMEARRVEEVGGEITLAPWWGTDPLASQVGLELYGQGGAWRDPDSTATEEYVRASAVLRLAVPLASARWRIGLEAGGGTTWGEAPLQRSWFLGGPMSLRGYSASVRSGSTFARGRLEVARTYPQAVTLSWFGDVGWAGVREDLGKARPLYGIGMGASLLDGLIRLDLSHGLRGPEKRFRVDLYLDALL